ncbi:MAG: N-acetyltransferase family protein [Pseudomonadota bacterium]
MDTAQIRRASAGDAMAISTIWNEIIRDTIATFTSAEKAPAVLASLMQDQPFWVAEDAGRVLGFATYAQFRGGPGYAHTMEHTVHLAPQSQRQGVGRALMAHLEEAARTDGVHSLMAGISGENSAGLAFHRALGYLEAARLPQVGYKFGRWHDLVLMQKFL